MDRWPRISCVFIGCVLLASPALGQNGGIGADLSRQIEKDLSSIYRYDSDISISAGVWISQFVHLRLDSTIPKVIFLQFDPRLLSQVADNITSASPQEPHGSVEFREYTFDVDGCAGLSISIDALKAALRESVGTIGERSGAPELDEIIVDGRHYEVKVRINRHFEGSFGVGENDVRLFGPGDSMMRHVSECSQNSSWKLRRHD